MQGSLEKLIEENPALEGLKWSVEERFKNLEALYERFLRLNSYPPKPFVRSFDSFEEYEEWRKKQTSPWYW